MAANDEIETAGRAKNRVATILAIGTANPSNVVYQKDFPEFYFGATNSEHMTDLKANFKLICEKTTVKKRYMHISEKLLKENPNMCDYNAASLDTRQVIQATEIPRLGKEASMKALQEWGQPKSKITHLIFCTTSPVDMPGPDYHLTRLLGLSPSVKRNMLLQHGCYAGGTALRLAKDLAENNPGARVLVVCSENTVMYFHGPSDQARPESMAHQALFGDGAAAVIVGADLDESSTERPIFQLVSTSQTILPDSEGTIEVQLREFGLPHQVNLNIPELVSNNIDKVLVEAFSPIGINDWNSIFWISHPGNPKVLSRVESKLGLNKTKLSTVRHVLSEFGNMSSATVLFVMDEMRNRSLKEGKATTGDGLDLGILFAFGPGFTVETIVLRSFPLSY